MGPEGPVRLRYQTVEIGRHDVHLRTLRDRQQLGDATGEAAQAGVPEAMWSIFGVVWPAGLALARLMAIEDIVGRRIVEVGCGIALPSQILNARGADITATDRHPEAGRFLDRNTDLNEEARIPFVRGGWADEDDAELGTFDLIIGSDLLYEREPTAALARFVERHARPRCEVLLLRWAHPTRGMLRPGVFLEDLERTGVMGEVGEWVLDQACELAVAWLGNGVGAPKVVVNVSGSQLRRPGFVASVAARLAEHGLAGDRLRIDVQEACLPDAPADVLHALGDLGIGFAVDDFGSTGQAIPLLPGLPVDTLKLEPRLVRGIELGSGGREEAAALILLGQRLVGRVAAEHVETLSQLAFLCSHGCDRVSGYLVGAPMSGPVFEDWLGRTPAPARG